MRKSWLHSDNTYENLFEFLCLKNEAFGQGNGEDVPEPLPDAIKAPLAQWALFYDVPFQYLVPREDLLPEESVRFFYVDFDYIFALLDGAFSLGRAVGVDYEHDAAVIEDVLETAFTYSKTIRPRLLGKQPQVYETQNVFTKKFTGFLMRSALVRGWRGLEFQVYPSATETTWPLQALRLETLGPDVLLGIYEGEIRRVEVAQPPEGMHFGFAKKVGGGYEKRMRDLDSGQLYETTAADVVLRNPSRRVVNFAATARNVGEALHVTGPVTSAHMALEMIQNPFTGVIQKSGNSSS